MTTDRTYRRRLAALALAPAVAGLFGGSVAWAAATNPLAAPADSTALAAPTDVEAQTLLDGQARLDQARLEAQVAEASARLAAVRAAALGAGPVPEATPTPERTAPPARTAPPVVDVLTRAS